MYVIDRQRASCTGCRACADVCPKACITMEADHEGFLYPSIDRDACIHCRLCEQVCPIGYEDFSIADDAEVWVGVHRCADVIQNSASGGAFTAIYETLIREGYVVWGVIFDEHLCVKHAPAETVEACEAFRRSKYVLSDTDHCFVRIADQLADGRSVCFTGTPCQCAALRSFLRVRRIDTARLLVIDLVCHGAPNQEIFDAYLAELEAGANASVRSFSFKNKRPINGAVNSRSACIVFSSGEERLVTPATDAFLNGYYSRLFYRPSCGVCRFARPERVSDMTIGDAWHIEEVYPEWDPLRGVSLILANSQKGRELAVRLGDHMTLRPESMAWATEHNQQLRRPTDMHKNRDKFFRVWRQKGVHRAVRRATKRPLLRRVAGKIKRCLVGTP